MQKYTEHKPLETLGEAHPYTEHVVLEIMTNLAHKGLYNFTRRTIIFHEPCLMAASMFCDC